MGLQTSESSSCGSQNSGAFGRPAGLGEGWSPGELGCIVEGKDLNLGWARSPLGWQESNGVVQG